MADGRRPDPAFRRAWGTVLSIDDWDQWELAPELLNYDEAEAWAEDQGYDGRVIWLSSGDTLVQVSENFTGAGDDQS